MTFQAFEITSDRLALEVVRSPVGPIHLRSWAELPAHIPISGSACVLPVKPTLLIWPHVECHLEAGCYAVVPGGTTVYKGAGLIIHTPAYRGLSQAGGPVEALGRLAYIDGCSDTLLVCPAQRGEPCLNLLHLPAGVDQTQHTHPSDRIGIILRGAGRCRTNEGETELRPGMFWFIPAEYPHSFHTTESSLDVLAWHPDSDFGPSHDEHPMINRTIIDGVAANDERHADIRTRGKA